MARHALAVDSRFDRESRSKTWHRESRYYYDDAAKKFYCEDWECLTDAVRSENNEDNLLSTTELAEGDLPDDAKVKLATLRQLGK